MGEWVSGHVMRNVFTIREIEVADEEATVVG